VKVLARSNGADHITFRDNSGYTVGVHHDESAHALGGQALCYLMQRGLKPDAYQFV
jgi:hypothetical protein